jgi:hypothetical protein
MRRIRATHPEDRCYQHGGRYMPPEVARQEGVEVGVVEELVRRWAK